ncbi:MAG: DUF5906 domain-containing protein [Hyphomonas sp.]
MNAPTFHGDEYTEDFELLPLHKWDAVKMKDGKPVNIGKAPMHKDWTNRAFDRALVKEATTSGHNYGVRLTAEHLVVDVDPRNMPEGRDTFAELCEALDINPDDYPIVRTGSGGLHVYMWKPRDVVLVNELPGFPGVEFKSAGRQVVAAGSIHPDTGEPYAFRPNGVAMWEAPAAPPALLALAEKRTKDPKAGKPGEFTPEQVAGMLSHIDPENFRDRSDWLQLMMSAHHASGGTAEHEWIEWATSDPAFSDAEEINRHTWQSLGRGRGVTAGTLIHHAKQGGWNAPAETRIVDEGIAEWVWVAQSQIFIRERDDRQFNREAWKSMFAGEWPDGDILTAVWKDKTPVRKFERSVYEPGKDRFLGSDLNLWVPSGIEPAPGDVTPFIEHMELLLPDERERELFLDYLHFIVCKPAEKMMFAALIQGEQGVGKSIIGQLVTKCIGARNVSTPTSEVVKRDFTGWQEGCSLVLVEELMTEGRLEVANKLKRVITEPTLVIERKGLDAYDIPNRLNLLCFTNHKDAVRLESGDRRWFVLFSPMKPQPQAYYDKLFAWLNREETAPAFMYWLAQRNPALQPKGRAPDTNAKAEAAELSLNEVESQVKEWLEASDGPFREDLFRFDDVRDCFPRMRTTQIKTALSNAGAKRQKRCTNPKSKPNHQIWSIRNHELYEAMGPAEIAAHYNKTGGDLS